jgi:hypothetical protein
MPEEPVFLEGDLKRRALKAARENNTTVDEFLANAVNQALGTPANGHREAGAADARPPSSQRFGDMVDQMREVYMMRAMAGGQVPPGIFDGGGKSEITELREQVRELRELILDGGRRPTDEGLGADPIVKQAFDLKKMQTVLKAMGTDDDGGGGNRMFREYEKEMRERLEKMQDQQLRGMLEHNKEMADWKDKANEARLADYKGTVDSLAGQIADLSDRLERGPPNQQQGVAEQLTSALSQAAAVQDALTKIAKAGQPQAPVPGQQRDTIETIGYLANELSGAVSKGLEAVAKVNAANRGMDPNAMGRMPTAPQGPATYRPQYVPEPAARPAPRAASREMRAQASEAGATMPPGSRLPFEAPRRTGPNSPVAPAAQAAAEPQPEQPPVVLTPLDPSITEFHGLNGEPISREQYQALREQIYRERGVDPVQVIDPVDETPVGLPGVTTPPAQEEEGEVGGDAGGTPDEGSS